MNYIFVFEKALEFCNLENFDYALGIVDILDVSSVRVSNLVLVCCFFELSYFYGELILCMGCVSFAPGNSSPPKN